MYKSLVFQLRAEGISVSDRRVVKILKLCASAWLDGLKSHDDGNLFLLGHAWNSEEPISVIEGLVDPVLEAFHRDRPERRRVGAVAQGVDALACEIDRIRRVLTEGAPPSDVQLFSQLRALDEIRAALAGHAESARAGRAGASAESSSCSRPRFAREGSRRCKPGDDHGHRRAPLRRRAARAAEPHRPARPLPLAVRGDDPSRVRSAIMERSRPFSNFAWDAQAPLERARTRGAAPGARRGVQRPVRTRAHAPRDGSRSAGGPRALATITEVM